MEGLNLLQNNLMSMDKHSDRYKKLSLKDYPQLEGVYSILSNVAYNGIEFVELPNGRIGLCCELEVDAGTNSLLRFREPVIIGVSITSPEGIVPIAYPDRLDFPFDKFPHVNYPSSSLPPSLCLSREDADEWYSEISFRQYVKTLVEWLNDAANDRLIKLTAKDNYEPYRIPDNASWHLFRNNDFDNLIEKCDHNVTLYFDTRLFDDLLAGRMKVANPTFDSEALTINLSKGCSVVETDWYIETPPTLSELYTILSNRGYQMDVEDLYQKLCDHPNIKRIFLSFSVIRPTRLVGKRSRVDTICYTFEADSIRNKEDSVPIEPVWIFEIVTPQFAAWLSKSPENVSMKKILIIGLGAVGSAIADLLFRSGICKLTLCDNDGFNPHNVCRHVLSKRLTFKSKTELMKEHLEEMLYECNRVEVINQDAVEYIQTDTINDYDIIIDASASSRVMYALDEHCLEKTIVRVCLSNSGKVGMLYLHRKNDAKLHEFYYQILREALNTEEQVAADIASWLNADRHSTLDRIRIGEGCHSNTMQMGYNKVTPHCGLAVSVIKNIDNVENENLYLGFSDYDYEGSMYTERFRVPQFLNIECDVNGWQVRIPEDLMAKIQTNIKINGNKETGGYLMGLINEKRRTIHILDTFIPQDSKHYREKLELGTKGWNDYQRICTSQTAGQLSYLGDWHSHPYGTVKRSQTDIETFSRLRPELRGLGVCVITNGTDHKAYIILK